MHIVVVHVAERDEVVLFIAAAFDVVLDVMKLQ